MCSFRRSISITARPCADDGRPTTASWLAFWDSPHPIYVSARHKDVHYHLIARDIAALVARYAPTAARVLDYGSGEALHSDIVAAVAGDSLLCEGAPQRARRARRALCRQAEDPRDCT